MMKIETTILSNLIYNEEYTRKVIPFIKEEYFQDGVEKIVFKTIWEYVDKYKKNPTTDILSVEVEKTALNEEQYKSSIKYLSDLVSTPTDLDWLTDQTEKWCKDKAIYNAILNGIHIIDGKDKNQSPDALPSILSEALAVSFDKHIGHDYMEQSEDRYEFYHRVEEKIPFDLTHFNDITNGGLRNKTLNICLAGTGVGKSLFMCHTAASILLQGRSVLYITLELSEERIAERIDANLMRWDLNDLSKVYKLDYENKFETIQKKISKASESLGRPSEGNLIIKEYPTASAHCGHFRSLLNELQLKKEFRPDIVFIDYINICASSRFKYGSNVNSYTYIKGVAEEMRGLAVEFNLPIMSATQTTRQGFTSSDIGLEDTSESFGLPATADLMFALIQDEKLLVDNQLKVKQLKNRYADPSGRWKSFQIGVDRPKMLLYDIDQSVEDDSNNKAIPTQQEIRERRDTDWEHNKSRRGSSKFDVGPGRNLEDVWDDLGFKV